jgi:hypothetical protein
LNFKEDKWFEVWFAEGEDGSPSYLLILKPDTTTPGKVMVIDPHEGNKIIRSGQDYEETRLWLLEDEFSLVEGREFSQGV